MESVIERNAMVNSINDSGSFKKIDADSSLQNTNRKANGTANNEASNVNLSDASQQIAMLKEIVMQDQIERAPRIKALQQLLETGRYQIVDHLIAERMLADMQLAYQGL